MEESRLSREEIESLGLLLENPRCGSVSRPILARLEKLGLLMRGWSRTYVVTDAGLKVLNLHGLPLASESGPRG